jgi:hypothetical protein
MSTGFDQGARPSGAFGRLADHVLGSDDADRSVRWKPSEPLHRLVEERCDQLLADGNPGRLAVGRRDLEVTYAELDARSTGWPGSCSAGGSGQAHG